MMTVTPAGHAAAWTAATRCLPAAAAAAIECVCRRFPVKQPPCHWKYTQEVTDNRAIATARRGAQLHSAGAPRPLPEVTLQIHVGTSLAMAAIPCREQDGDEIRFYAPCSHVGLAVGGTNYLDRREFDLLRPAARDGAAPPQYGSRTPTLLASSNVFGFLFIGTHDGGCVQPRECVVHVCFNTAFRGARTVHRSAGLPFQLPPCWGLLFFLFLNPPTACAVLRQASWSSTHNEPRWRCMIEKVTRAASPGVRRRACRCQLRRSRSGDPGSCHKRSRSLATTRYWQPRSATTSTCSTSRN